MAAGAGGSGACGPSGGGAAAVGPDAKEAAAAAAAAVAAPPADYINASPLRDSPVGEDIPWSYIAAQVGSLALNTARASAGWAAGLFQPAQALLDTALASGVAQQLPLVWY